MTFRKVGPLLCAALTFALPVEMPAFNSALYPQAMAQAPSIGPGVQGPGPGISQMPNRFGPSMEVNSTPATEGPKPEAGDKKPGKSEKPDDGSKPAEAKPEGPKGPIQRKDKPSEAADPEELNVRPDQKGMVRFNFRGQAWPDVLDWLADISKTSLDWQELPGDYLNLTTQRAYSIDEVRDLINERLMTRGYTILQQQEGLVVAKLEGLNTARVPRVHSEDLRHRDAHEFVKVSFPLSWLLAEDAVEELKPMLGPHGTMAALPTSNRLEVMDVVTNLRQIQHVLQEEQSSEVRSTKVHEFYLEYTRAEDVLAKLESLLGIRKASGGMGMMDPNMMQQMQQQMQQQMMQQMQQQQPQGGGKPRRKPAGSDDIHLVINSRQNSIIANAPPDKLVVIAEAVKLFDVPSQSGSPLGANFQRVEVYRLAQLDPKSLQAMLLQSGNLDPTTQLVIDDKNNALIANAGAADQITIQALINKLDGAGREFKVIRLRRLQADYVAGSIRFMMGEEEKEDDSNSRRGYYSMYGYGRQPEQNNKKDKFRVDADVINNRLLLRANEVEMASIENLLVQLGEIPPGGDSQRGKLRTLEAGSSGSAEEMLKRLKELWPQVSPAPLQIKLPESKPKEETPPPSKAEPPKKENSAQARSRITVPVHLAAVNPAEDEASEQRPLEELSQEELRNRFFPKPESKPANNADGSKPPVVIQVDENGRITLASDDPAALDLLEDLLIDLTPEPKDWEVFELKYASAYWVAWNLEDFFEEKEEEEDTRPTPWYWDYGREEKKEDPLRLSQRKKLKFLSDTDTNTIVVQNANAAQLATIKDLIELYDKPEPVVEASKRLNATYAVRYSRASAIAESVKEVFRDLLSSNDKSLQQPQQGGGGDRDKAPDRYASDYVSRSGTGFKGKLSIGVDDISNTLLISTEGESLMSLVMDMVKRIDESAKPVSTVRIVNLKTGVNGTKMKELLTRLLENQNPQPQQPPQDPNGQPNANGQPDQNGPRGQRGMRMQDFQGAVSAEN
ncbi:secretin N-terminal domain-containing protein [Bremerella cremea]|uniref:secretin N-terminal domain-containing protein n=1 Tax=Bremerella cremea TaxID=1031537 RepID=UPI0031E66F9A